MATEQRRISELTHHPILTGSPMLPESHDEYRQIVQSLSETGFTEPVRIDSKNRIVDGRHRVRAAGELGFEDVPVVIVPDGDVEGTIVRSLVARRHLAKWQICYCMWTLLKPRIQKGVLARIMHLKRGTEKRENPNVFPKSAASGFGEMGLVEALESWGISHDTFLRVKGVMEVFEKRQDLREKYERRLFASGEEALSLEAVAKALGGIMGYEANPPDLKANRADHAGIIRKWIQKTSSHFAHWDKVGKKEREETIEAIVAVANTWPDEVRRSLKSGLEK